jgi:hypothetical protein
MSDFDQPKKSARGGKRLGAGRRPGVPNKATVDRQNEVAATGATPLQVLIDTMRYHYREAQEKKRDKDHDRREVATSLQAACVAAEKAAPYVHPKLASIVSKVDTTMTKAADVNDARTKLQTLLGNAHTGTAANGTGKPN